MTQKALEQYTNIPIEVIISDLEYKYQEIKSEENNETFYLKIAGYGQCLYENAEIYHVTKSVFEKPNTKSIEKAWHQFLAKWQPLATELAEKAEKAGIKDTRILQNLIIEINDRLKSSRLTYSDEKPSYYYKPYIEVMQKVREKRKGKLISKKQIKVDHKNDLDLHRLYKRTRQKREEFKKAITFSVWLAHYQIMKLALGVYHKKGVSNYFNLNSKEIVKEIYQYQFVRGNKLSDSMLKLNKYNEWIDTLHNYLTSRLKNSSISKNLDIWDERKINKEKIDQLLSNDKRSIIKMSIDNNKYAQNEVYYPQTIPDRTRELEKSFRETSIRIHQESLDEKNRMADAKNARILATKEDKYTHAVNLLIEHAEAAKISETTEYADNGTTFSIPYYSFNFDDHISARDLLEAFFIKLRNAGCFKNFSRGSMSFWGTNMCFTQVNLAKLKKYIDKVDLGTQNKLEASSLNLKFYPVDGHGSYKDVLTKFSGKGLSLLTCLEKAKNTPFDTDDIKKNCNPTISNKKHHFKSKDDIDDTLRYIRSKLKVKKGEYFPIQRQDIYWNWVEK